MFYYIYFLKERFNDYFDLKILIKLLKYLLFHNYYYRKA